MSQTLQKRKEKVILETKHRKYVYAKGNIAKYLKYRKILLFTSY